MLVCPLCKSPLTQESSRYLCPNQHSFDRSKTGVVQLNRFQSAKAHGDNKELILARQRFLSTQTYAPIRQALIEQLKRFDFKSLVDLGCGEGYYTHAILQAFPEATVFAIDLSKEGLKLASKTGKAHWILSSVAHCPLADHSCDVAISLFAPIYPDEIARILKPEGILITMTPNPDHLIQLKQVLYPSVIRNKDQAIDHPDFKLVSQQSITFMMHLKSPAKDDLLKMTPYAHTSNPDAIQRVLDLAFLDVLCDVSLKVYARI